MKRARRHIGVLATLFLGGCALWSNAETEILSQLKLCEAGKVLWKGGEGEVLEAERMLYQRLTVLVEEDRKRAQGIGTLDLDGILRGGGKEAYIRSLGFERIEFVYEEGRWKPQKGCIPQLEEVLRFLAASKFFKGEGGEAVREDTLGWNIRVSREAVRISQEYATRRGGEKHTGWRTWELKRGADGKLKAEAR